MLRYGVVAVTLLSALILACEATAPATAVPAAPTSVAQVSTKSILVSQDHLQIAKASVGLQPAGLP